jgi:hypothetical protein
VSIARNIASPAADTCSMTDPIDRRQPATCRLPGDGSDDDDREPEKADGGTSEAPRLACMTDVDWNEMPSHDDTPFGPPPPPPKAAVPQATNNATRTSERDLASGPYASAGYAAGGHAVFAGAALVKGRDASGLELEATTVSVQVGAQSEAQGAVVRASVSGAHGAIGSDLGSASAHAGIHNADGSTGLNAGAGAVAIAGEATLSGKANSITIGAGYGVGGEASIGVRDKDGNGEPEVCFRVGLKFATVGACVELPFHGKM